MSKVLKSFFFICSSIFLLHACGEESDPQELIEKVRGIGMNATPLITSSSVTGSSQKEVSVTVYAAVPSSQKVSIMPFKDQATYETLVLEESDITVDQTSAVYTSYSGFDLLTFTATLKVPFDGSFAKTNGYGQFKYGFKLQNSTTSQIEIMVGQVLVYPEGSSSLSWSAPQILSLTPQDGSSLTSQSEVGLEMSFTNPQQEEVLVGWFASSGTIVNRRAKSTTWKPANQGAQTVIATVRGKQSHGFSLKVITVNL